MIAARPQCSICVRCLFRRNLLYRSLSTAQASFKPPPPPPTGFTKLISRRLLSLHGRDAAHFLQGITTTNIRPSAPHGWYSAFLNAQGRVLHDVFIYPAGHSSTFRDSLGNGEDGEQGFLIEVDKDEADRLARWMKRYKLRAKVGIKVCEEGQWGIWSVWDEGDKWTPHELSSSNAPAPQDGAIGCVDARAPGMGRRVVVAGDAKPEGLGEGHEEAGLGQYTVRRMMRGVPEGQGEILRETALPQESCVDYMGGIDFRKGCYVGQELTIRTHHTGVVRKRILPVQLYAAAGDVKPPETLRYDAESGLVLPPQGTNISRADTKGRSAGKWVGGVGNIGLALCRLEVMTDMVLTGEGSQWGPEHEFKLSWDAEKGREGGQVKIKAFVPGWHRNKVNV
ncbi:ccr4 associated factor [Hypocenomyce scalaris]|nr:ccr4 associated factor [Hypocenomyce scalaris]